MSFIGQGVEGPGGHVSGSGYSTSTQSAAVNFIPGAPAPSEQPIVSVYPAGQGLATINSAYPSSAAYQASTYAGNAPASSTPASSSLSLGTVALVLAAGAAAWLLLRKRR